MNHLVFVYGTLKRGERNFDRMAGARFICTAATCDAAFTLREYKSSTLGYEARRLGREIEGSGDLGDRHPGVARDGELHGAASSQVSQQCSVYSKARLL